MTQPIDRETAIALAKEVWCCDIQSLGTANLEVFANLAVSHSRKDAEPVAYQYRMKPEWHDAWVKWQPCDKANFDDYVKAPVINGWQFDARALFTHPPDADKLLQQALEALEYRLQQTRPIHQADSVMEAIRTYLEGKK